MKQLYIFNPDHDLALASNSEYYDAPKSAKIFETDFALLPLWYGEPESEVFANSLENEWFDETKKLFPQMESRKIVSAFTKVKISPWGWNKTIRRTCEKNGCSLLPMLQELDDLRILQHRKLSILATKYLSALKNENLHLANPASLLSAYEIDEFVEKHPFSIFKAPWSGSGKGIVRSLGSLSENLKNRVCNVAKSQGSVVAEPLYDVVQDFAMEFYCENGTCSFAGYSWFFTNEHGAYLGNLLATDEIIATKLSQWISLHDLERIKNKMMAFLNENVAAKYSGFLGVDMFAYQQDGNFFVHPCVEINLRMTMGLVARLFYDKYVKNGETGTYMVDFYQNSNDLLADHLQRSQQQLVVVDGKIQKGYVSLNPIHENTHYRARVELL